MKLTLRQQITQFAHVLQTGLLTALNEELGELTEPAIYDSARPVKGFLKQEFLQNFSARPAQGELQLQADRRRFWRAEGSLRENSSDAIRERVEPEGWNTEEPLRDDQQLLT